MKRFEICKADPAGEPVDSVMLQIDRPVGDIVRVYSDPAAFYDDEAALLMEALASLPGGTFDALLIKMLDRKRSLLRVRES